MKKPVRKPVQPSRRVVISRYQFGFRVRPGTLRIDPAFGLGRAFRLTNATGFVVLVEFPESLDVVDSRGVKVVRFALPNGGDKDLTVRTRRTGRYEYVVLIREARIEASGHSRPDIEIVK
jgi:hypothetical protein